MIRHAGWHVGPLDLPGHAARSLAASGIGFVVATAYARLLAWRGYLVDEHWLSRD